MSGIAIIVVGPDPERARAALRIAAAAAALDRPAAVLFDGVSVVLLSALDEELADARDLGVHITACATGIADHGVPPLPGIESGGLVGFLTANRQAQLLAV